MSRKARTSDDDGGDAIDFALIGAKDFVHRYVPPSESCPKWELPEHDQIIEDFARCGSDLSIYLQAALPDGNKSARQMLLGAIVMHLKASEPHYKLFCDMRDAGEEARLMLLEEAALAMAKYDTGALKFVLEKRRADRFGKSIGAGDDASVVAALEKLLDKIKGARQSNG